jgi:hypothetical protein
MLLNGRKLQQLTGTVPPVAPPLNNTFISDVPGRSAPAAANSNAAIILVSIHKAPLKTVADIPDSFPLPKYRQFLA